MDQKTHERTAEGKDELSALIEASRQFEVYQRLMEAANTGVIGQPVQKQADWTHPMGLVITRER
jgi:hypothetical protein